MRPVSFSSVNAGQRSDNCLTCHTVVRELEVGLELLQTLADLVELGVGHGHLAGTPARASAVKDVQNVGLAAEEAQVGLDTAAQAHAPVSRCLHDDDLAVVALRSQLFRLAQLRVLCTASRDVCDVIQTWYILYGTSYGDMC